MMINRCWRGKQHTQKCLREYTIHAGVSYSWSFIEIGNSYDPRYWDFFYSSEFTMPDTHNTTEFADPTPGKQGSARMAQGWRKNMFMGEVYGEFSKSCCGVADRTQDETSNHRRLTTKQRSSL